MKLLTLVLGTGRELSAKATLYVLAGISTLILLGAAATLSRSTTDEGSTLLLFGNPAGPPATPEVFSGMVNSMEAAFAGGLFAGVVLFGMFATAGVLPDALERGTVDLYLSKPIARWELLAGKYCGSVLAMFVNIIYFIGFLWIIVGVRVGIWNMNLLLAGLMMTFAFACLFAIVSLFGVLTRNMAISIIVGFVYLFVISEVLQNREEGLYHLSTNEIYRGILDGLYYVFPQIPAMQHNVLKLVAGNGIEWRPFVQSFLSSTGILALAAWILGRKDF
jgi:ABC-type transport system involved in multi-copper enzyme maturation permease subunit